MSEKILITGAAGIVGGHLAQHLTDRGFDVIATDIRDLDEESRALQGAEWIRGDLSDPDFVRKLPRTSGVIHAAGMSRTGRAMMSPAECVRSGVFATTLLLEAVHRHVSWFLLLSTRMVTHLEQRSGVVLGLEDTYAISKQATEQLLACFGATHGFSTMAVRLSDVYGSPRDHTDKCLPAFVRSCVEDRPLEIRDASAYFHFVHIDDVLQALDQAVDDLRKGGRFGIRELWTRPGITITELAELVKKIAGGPSPIVDASPRATPAPASSSLRPVATWTMCQSVTLEEGIRRMVRRR